MYRLPYYLPNIVTYCIFFKTGIHWVDIRISIQSYIWNYIHNLLKLIRTATSSTLMTITIAYGAGIVLCNHFDSILPLKILPAAFAALFFILFICLYKKHLLAIVLLTLIFMGIGFFNQSISKTPTLAANHIARHIQTKTEAVLVGRVARTFSYDGKSCQFDLQSVSLRKQESEIFQDVTGLIRVRFAGKLPEYVQPGVDLAIRLHLNTPRRYRTPGSFDYPAYLASHNIYITGKLKSRLHLHKIPSLSNLYDLPRYRIEKVRHTVNHMINEAVEGDNAAIYQALLTGDRSAVSKKSMEMFRRTGVLHLLAISGLHVSLLGIAFFTLIYWLLRRSTFLIFHISCKKTAVLITIIPLLGYTLLAGGKTPVLRAFIMALFATIALCSNRKVDVFHLLCSAALILLLFFPDSLQTASFQLTFMAVFTIFMALPLLPTPSPIGRDRVPAKIGTKGLYWLFSGLLFSFLITLTTAPLLLVHFNRISIAGILSTFIIEPILCFWSLLCGFAAIPLLFTFKSAGLFFIQIGGYGIEMTLRILGYINQLPAISFYLPAPPTLVTVLFYIGLFLTIHYLAKKKHLMAGYSSVFLAVAVLLYIFPPPTGTEEDYTSSEIVFLDIGQGSCTLIQTPSNKNILIDGGTVASPDFDIGRAVIAPFLWKRNIGKIDHIIITHPDSDHYNGLFFILQHFPVNKLWTSRLDGSSRWKELLKTARLRQVKIEQISTEKILVEEENVSLTILMNTDDGKYHSHGNSGLVSLYTHHSTSVLFPGDIPAAAEHQLIHTFPKLRADVLLASHHGSKTSNSRAFLEKISPKIIVTSAGYFQKNRFPSQALLDFTRKNNIQHYATHTEGTVFLTITNAGWKVHTIEENLSHWPFSGKIHQTSVKSVGGFLRNFTKFAFSTQLE